MSVYTSKNAELFFKAKVAQFMNEATEAHAKMLRANSEKYPDVDLL